MSENMSYFFLDLHLAHMWVSLYTMACKYCLVFAACGFLERLKRSMTADFDTQTQLMSTAGTTAQCHSFGGCRGKASA